MSSLNENKGKKLVRNNLSGFIQHTKHQLVRIYPKASRTDSSNYDPIPFWNAGCQMGEPSSIFFVKHWMYLLFPFISIVALNYQTSGLFKSINDTLFQVNGNCGYVLKPAILRDHGGEVDVTSYEG